MRDSVDMVSRPVGKGCVCGSTHTQTDIHEDYVYDFVSDADVADRPL